MGESMVRELDSIISELENVRRELEEFIMNAPEGSLRIAKNENRILYFQYNKNNAGKYRTGKYISKEKMPIIQQLAQKDYNVKLTSLIEKEIKLLEKIEKFEALENKNKMQIENVYDSLSLERKALVEPMYISNEEYAKKWQEEPYTKKPFLDGVVEIYTDRDERVRSKSEKILADRLFKRGIPYKYECPIMLNNRIIHPDFTVLNVKSRKEIYWEHMGMMDNKEYAIAAVKRIDDYGKNGICVGDNLILTFETSVSLLKTQDIDQMIDRFIV